MHIGTVLTQKPGEGSVGRLLVTSPRLDPGRISALAHGLIVAGLIVVLLIAGREVLEPLVIAALLASILSPLIRRLRQWGVWRAPVYNLCAVHRNSMRKLMLHLFIDFQFCTIYDGPGHLVFGTHAIERRRWESNPLPPGCSRLPGRLAPASRSGRRGIRTLMTLRSPV